MTHKQSNDQVQLSILSQQACLQVETACLFPTPPSKINNFFLIVHVFNCNVLYSTDWYNGKVKKVKNLKKKKKFKCLKLKISQNIKSVAKVGVEV